MVTDNLLTRVLISPMARMDVDRAAWTVLERLADSFPWMSKTALLQSPKRPATAPWAESSRANFAFRSATATSVARRDPDRAASIVFELEMRDRRARIALLQDSKDAKIEASKVTDASTWASKWARRSVHAVAARFIEDSRVVRSEASKEITIRARLFSVADTVASKPTMTFSTKLRDPETRWQRPPTDFSQEEAATQEPVLMSCDDT